MKILRFIGTVEMNYLTNGEVITPKQTYDDYGTTLGTDEVIYFFDISRAYDDKLEYGWDSKVDDLNDTIMFYKEVSRDIVDADFAVVSDTENFEDYKVGVGDYGKFSYYDPEDEPYNGSNPRVITHVYINEVGVDSYSLDDIDEVYMFVKGNNILKVYDKEID